MNNTLKINDILYTKDGRTIGNAIVTDISKSELTDHTIYWIKTDYGNVCRLVDAEIGELFYTDQLTEEDGYCPPHKYAV